MNETSTNSVRRHLEHNVARFASCPTPRCYATVGNSSRNKCGALAAWKVAGGWWFEDEFFCDVHRPASAVMLVGDRVMRRVRIRGSVLIAGVSMNSPIAHTEAVARLQAVLAELGAVLDIEDVSSTVGLAAPPRATAGTFVTLGTPE